MKNLLMIAAAGMMFVSGCTTVISEQSRKLVDSNVQFSQLREHPDNYIGKHVMLGGKIADIKNSGDGARIEVVQFELNDNGVPENSFISYGRFLATSTGFLDPLIFNKGRLITLVGEVKGKKSQRLDDMDYIYPVIALREWHLWSGPEFDRGYLYPPPYPNYDPYYFGYGYEPFWYRSYAPMYWRH